MKEMENAPYKEKEHFTTDIKCAGKVKSELKHSLHSYSNTYIFKKFIVQSKFFTHTN